jgi:hypothetical protein
MKYELIDEDIKVFPLSKQTHTRPHTNAIQ